MGLKAFHAPAVSVCGVTVARKTSELTSRADATCLAYKRTGNVGKTKETRWKVNVSEKVCQAKPIPVPKPHVIQKITSIQIRCISVV